jgi:ABC-type spermidine/putrescine transport system permease subunit II
VVATVVAFTVSFNELPVSQYLCTPPECRTVPMALGGQVLGDVPPTSFALGMIATLVSIASLGVLVPVLRSGRRAM